VSRAAYAPGDRVRVRADHWSGQGARSGRVLSSSPDRSLVRFDDPALVDVDTRAIEPAPPRYEARHVGGEAGTVPGWLVWDTEEDTEWEYDPDVEKQAGVSDSTMAYTRADVDALVACLNEREARYGHPDTLE
jgi:hypothetical protein